MKILPRAAAISIALLVLGSAPAVFSQRLGHRSEDDVRRVADRIRENTERFRHSLDSSLDRNALDGSRAEDRINDFVRDFERSTDRLREHWDDNRSVQDVLDRAAAIDRFVLRHASSGPVFDDWMRLRAKLDELAGMYGVGWNWSASGPISGPVSGPVLESASLPQRINDHEVKSAISRIESEADRFRHSLHEALEHSHISHSEENDVNRFVKNFETATDRLKHHFDSHNPATADAEEVMRRAAEIDRFMRSNALNGRAQEDWRALRRDLDVLAAAYGVTWRWDQ